MPTSKTSIVGANCGWETFLELILQKPFAFNPTGIMYAPYSGHQV